VLDTRQSFLVQAPAGAGKTELLVRRYLCLLAEAKEPEEILAVTFTRKAAAEMQRRIVGALSAGTDPGSSGDAGAGLRQLVAAVRHQDAARGWQLARHPARLRISTIDALNAALARSAPVSAGASVLRPVAEQPERLYRLAARGTLRLLGDAAGPGAAVADLLGHLDNDLGRAEDLLAKLLARRDQWLPFIGAGLDLDNARQALEGSLARLVERALERVDSLIPAGRREELAEVLHAAAINRRVELRAGAAEAPLADRAAWWRFAAGILLTGDQEWRRSLTVREGFPPDQKDLKVHALELLAVLRRDDRLLAALVGVQQLPAPHYSAGQWTALEALLRLLPYAAAELKLAFAALGTTDYAEIAAEGRAALGDESAPSELALRVDWRLQHVLLDEFQDTSAAQYALLRALTRGWSPGDGRTLFLVGDPMQSIYRFRQAEVRLFLDVRDHGLPGLLLEFVRLKANFRSVPALVSWTNAVFARVFPPTDDLVSSAISFAPGEATRDGAQDDHATVTIHSSAWEHPGTEADDIVGVVRDTLARWPAGSIGILVRSRSHAASLLAALRAARIEVAATELVELGRTALANDLLAITRALVHAADRLAWLTVFRAPWCGLSLIDLERLASMAPGASLHDCAREAAVAPEDNTSLTADGRARLARVTGAFTAGLARLGQVPLRDVVEGVWLELGGPAVAGEELPLADLILDEIGRHDVGGDCPDVAGLAAALERIRGSLPAPGAAVQVMTIHKAKGLQFDTVIVPALGRTIRREDRPALLWQELAGPGSLDLLLAPINASGAADDPLYELLWDLRARQDLAEADRLLYVAVTRARDRLHLFGQVPPPRGLARDDAAARPARGSLLDRLWPALGNAWPGRATAAGEAGDGAAATDPTARWRQPVLRRLPLAWRRPAPPESLPLPASTSAPTPALVPYDWASAWTRQAGAVAHRWLQQIAVEGVENYPDDALPSLRPRVRQVLVRQGVEAAAVDRATERVMTVLRAALADTQGRWLLSAGHAECLNEYAVTVAEGGRFRQLVIDRAFVDADGVRWIIDYKTSSHEGGDRQAFVLSEVQRYAPQLQAYRQALACLESRRQRTALYFPLLRLLRVVEPGEGTPGEA
jgi:ATP-dependent exoDNAse (exonuclease V) beta subunit